MPGARRDATSRGPLRLAALGPLEAYHGDTAIELGPPKQRAVLALLLVHRNRPVSVDRMIDELWGESPPPTALATLQAYVSNLRRALEPDRGPRQQATVIISRTAAYELAISEDGVDIGRFERGVTAGLTLVDADPAAASSALAEALALWRGPALVEFCDYAFAGAEAHRLEELRVGAVEQRIGSELRVRPTSAVVAELEQLVKQHPLRERFWLHLMHAYYLTGRQADALRAYRRCEETLVDELGISPSAELRALEQAILDQDPVLSVPPAAPRAEAGTGAPEPTESDDQPIVGRALERASFIDALDRAGAGRGTVMLISGPPGIGKTRLVEVLQEDARNRRCLTAMARCVEVGGSPPFWPWTQVVRSFGLERVLAAAGPYLDYLAPLFPEAADRATTSRSSAEASHRIAEALAHVIHQLSAAHPVVVFIDDLYSADPDSLSVLALLASAIETDRVVIVATHRGSRRAAHQQLADVLVQLSRFEWVRRHHLEPLDMDEIGELVTLVTGSPIADDTIKIIYERSDGNAFFATELARLLAANHHDASVPANRVPETVREVIERRLASIPPDRMELVRISAIIGRTFDLSVVAAVSGRSLDELIDLTDAALAMDMSEETDQPGRFRFSHLLLVDSVLSRLGTLRRAQLHHRVADALEAQFGNDPDRWDEIAHHRVEAVPVAGTAAAIQALARAGRRAAELHAFELAELHLEKRHSLVLTAPLSPTRDDAELESILDRAAVWTLRHGYQADEVRAATERMLELTNASTQEAMLDPTTETGVRHGVMAALQARCSFEIVSGNIEASIATAEIMKKLATGTESPYVEAVARLNRGIGQLHCGRLHDAIRDAERVDELLDEADPGRSGDVHLPLGQQSLAVTHLCFLGWMRWMTGDSKAATAAFTESRQIADRVGHQFSRALSTSIECVTAACAGDPDAVLAALAWGSPEGRHLFGFLDAMHELYRVWAMGCREHPADAARRLRKMVAELDAHGARVVQTLNWGLITDLHLRADSPADALDTARRGIDRAAVSGEGFWLAELHRLEAEALTKLGRDSNEAFDRALAAAERLSSPPISARLDHAARRSA